jgi:hypothetical protein
MTATDADQTEVESSPRFERPLPEFVDWLAGAVIAIGGLALLVGGSVLTLVVDRALIEEEIEAGRITVIVFERELSEPEMLSFTLDVVNWTGLGLVISGVGLVTFAVWYVIARHRAHGRVEAGDSAGSFLSNAVVGAVTTTVLFFIPFSPLVGGGVTGYLEGQRSNRAVSAAGLAGFLAMAPLVILLVCVGVGLYTGLAGVGDAGYGLVTAVAMLFATLFVAAYGAGVSALGGFVGTRFLRDRL